MRLLRAFDTEEQALEYRHKLLEMDKIAGALNNYKIREENYTNKYGEVIRGRKIYRVIKL